MLQELRSPDPTVRYSVLSRLEGKRWAEAEIAAFREHFAQETDPDTRFHMELILRHQDRGRVDRATVRASLSEVAGLLADDPPDCLRLVLALQDLTPADACLAVELLREKRWEEFPTQVLPFLLRLFRRHGSIQDVPAIGALFRQSNPRVLAAAVETLEKLSPQDLKSYLAPLLTNSSHGVQSMAIRALHAWEPAEALRYFDGLLFSKDDQARETALHFAYFFPFPEIEPAILRFLSLESAPSLISRAGRLCIINPDQGTVEKLSEILAVSSGEKARLLREVISQEVDFLAKAGLAGAGTAAWPGGNSAASSPGDDGGFVGLDSPWLTQRHLALLRLGGQRFAPGQTAALRDLWARETEPGTRLHLALLLARIDRAPDCPPDSEPPLPVMASILATPPLDSLALVAACERLPRHELAAGLDLLRQAEWWRFPAEPLPFLLPLFKRAGAPTDAAHVAPLCAHADPRVVLTAVEAMAALDPENLRPRLVELFLHDDPGVRGSATRFLYKLDPDEAMNHFASSLAAADEAERDAALHFAFFLDFPRIEPLLIKFLSLESNLSLIKKAGYLFQVNPIVEEPLKLLAVWEESSGEKRELIGAILRGVTEALSGAGIIAKSAEEILTDLKIEYRTRKIRSFVDQCRIILRSDEPGQRRKACERLHALAARGAQEALASLNDHLAVEADPENKAWLAALPGLTQSRPQPSAASPGTGSVGTMTGPDRERWLNGLSLAEFRKQAAQIGQLLESLPAAERIPVVRAFGACGTPPDALVLKKAIGKDLPSDLLLALIEAIQSLDIGVLDPLFPGLLRHESAEVREAAMQAYLRRDKRQALTWLEQLLFSPKREDRSLAGFCLGSVDFLTSADLVFAALEQESDPDLTARLGILIRDNVAAAPFCRLITLADQPTSEARSAALNRVVAEAGEGLLAQQPTLAPDLESLRLWARDHNRQQMERESKPQPAYALKNIQKARREKACAAVSPPGKLGAFLALVGATAEHMGIGGKAITAAVLILIAGWWAFFWVPAAPAPAADSFRSGGFAPPTADAKKDPLVVGQTRMLQGTVEETQADGLLIMIPTHQTRVFVQIRDSRLRNLAPGQRFEGRVRIEKRSRTRFLARLLEAR